MVAGLSLPLSRISAKVGARPTSPQLLALLDLDEEVCECCCLLMG